jgi:hypothetical protein
LVLFDGDLAQAWPLTDERFRRKLVGAWVRSNRKHQSVRGHEPDELVETLSRRDPTRHYLWPRFAGEQIEQFRTLWRNVDLERWLWASKPHTAPDYERVLLVDSVSEAARDRDQATAALGFVMHHTADRGWRVAEIAEPEVEDKKR